MTFFKTIRSKLLFSFAIFIVINCIVILVNLSLDAHRNRITEVEGVLSRVERYFLQLSQLEKDFFNDETINPKYYQTGSSPYLNRRNQLISDAQRELYRLMQSQDIEEFEVKEKLVALSYHVEMYERTFDSLVAFVRQRGFKDFGVEGTMRRYIHDIEAASPPLDLSKVLTIRRHEKDFILRKQPQYIEKLNNAVDKLSAEVQLKIANTDTRRNLILLLENYQRTFNQLVALERRIGFDHKSGTRGTLALVSNNIEEEILEINRVINDKVARVRQKIFITALIVMGLSVLAGILLAVFITHVLSKPIHMLSDSIERVIEANFSPDVQVAKIESEDEVGILANDFNLMLQKVRSSLQEVRRQSDKADEKRKLLLDSIRYAQKIQDAFLPHQEELDEVLGEHFIVYEPLHVVSGDFYWVGTRHEKLFFAVVDCTGHGVPGAFMSMIGSSLLDKIILQEKVFDPAQILERLHQEVKTALHQDKQNETDDGMEACLCRIDMVDLQAGRGDIPVQFAGARSPLYYTQGIDQPVGRVKGTKRAIGGKHKTEKRPFQTEILHIPRGQMLYLTSDGLTDQHDAQHKKYGKKRLEQLLARISKMPTEIQYDVVREELYLHMKGQVQRDDITLMGIRLPKEPHAELL